MADEALRRAHQQQAAERAVDELRSGMIVGLGAGSTALFALRRLAELLRSGALEDIAGVPCSNAVRDEAARLGVPLTTLDDHPRLDVTIDGADEVDPKLELIKGGGGALLHEKMVAQASRRELIVVDDGKLSPALGTLRRVPVEVVAFGWQAQARWLESQGAKAVALREGPGGRPFSTDEGHLLLDCDFGPLASPQDLAGRLERRAGVVEHGLFLGLATELFAAGEGGLRHLHRVTSPGAPGLRR